MDDAQVGWIAAIIIGGIAGWLAEQFMKSQMGLLMNIVLGIIGAAVASAVFTYFGVNPGRMARLPDRRIHRRMFANLDRSGSTSDPLNLDPGLVPLLPGVVVRNTPDGIKIEMPH